MTDAGLTAEQQQLVTIRDRWQIVSRQIEEMLVGQDFTGKIELNCLHSRVKNYVPSRSVIPEEEERRLADRRETPREGDDRRGSGGRVV